MKSMKGVLLAGAVVIIAIALSFAICKASAPKLSKKTVTLNVGQSAKLKIKGGSGKVKWKSSNKAVASVTSKGKITGNKAGNATITATRKKKKLKCKVTVINTSDKTSEDISSEDINRSIEASTSENAANPDTDNAGSKILVAYFSVTGNTRPYAGQIAEKTGADLYEIIPEVPYTSKDIDYNSDCRANKEQEDDTARPVISGSVPDFSKYETVFIGYPIWWGTCPKIIDTFMESYDFSGKKVIPFCTSGSSGISTSETHIRKVLTGAVVEKGHRASSKSDVDSWVESLKL